jgi:hypothetical protein
MGDEALTGTQWNAQFSSQFEGLGSVDPSLHWDPLEFLPAGTMEGSSAADAAAAAVAGPSAAAPRRRQRRPAGGGTPKPKPKPRPTSSAATAGAPAAKAAPRRTWLDKEEKPGAQEFRCKIRRTRKRTWFHSFRVRSPVP